MGKNHWLAFQIILGLLGLILAVYFFVHEPEVLLAPMEISECGELTEPNTEYFLISNVVNNDLEEACINITAENVTLDCQGHSIISESSVSGVYSNKFNSTVKNCNIDMGSAGFGIGLFDSNYSYVFNNNLSNQGAGIFVEYSYNLAVYNNSIHSNLEGIDFHTHFDFANVSGNIIYSNIADGILINSFGVRPAENLEISNNVLSNNKKWGIHGYLFKNSLISQNKISGTDYRAIDFTPGSNRIISNIVEDSYWSYDLFSPQFCSFFGCNIYEDNIFVDVMRPVIINSSLSSEELERTYDVNQEINLSIFVNDVDGSVPSDFKFEIVSYPSEQISAVKEGNELNVSFVPSREGLYSLVVNVTLQNGNSEKRKFVFLVGETQTDVITYYFQHLIAPQSINYRGGYSSDTGTLLPRKTVEGEEVILCANIVYFYIDEVFRPLPIVKNASFGWWYRTTGDFFVSATAQRWADRLGGYDYRIQLAPTSGELIWTDFELNGLNITSDYDYRLHWFGVNFAAPGSEIRTFADSLSYVNFTYLYAGPKISYLADGSFINRNVGVMSSTFFDESKKEAEIVLSGEGDVEIVIEMPDSSLAYDLFYDSVECGSGLCEVNSNSDGVINLSLDLGSEHTIFIKEHVSVPNGNNGNGGGGGGGGGGSTTQNCFSNWTCTSWSACENGVRYRNCVDARNCGVNTTRPSEIEVCEEALGVECSSDDECSLSELCLDGVCTAVEDESDGDEGFSGSSMFWAGGTAVIIVVFLFAAYLVVKALRKRDEERKKRKLLGKKREVIEEDVKKVEKI